MFVSVTLVLGLLVGLVAAIHGSCLVECEERSQLLMKMEARSKTSTCCDPNAVCEIFCRLREGKNGYTDLGIVEATMEPWSSAQARSTADRTWGSAVAVCRSCRRKRKSRSPLLREAALIARSVGLDLGTGAEGAEPSARYEQLQDVRLMSQSRRQESVSAEVSWQPQAPGPGPWYLVTWQAHGQALRGSLVTDTPSATLSLLPDTLYHLQIFTAGSEAPVGTLEVDTHSPPPAQPTHTLSLSRMEEGAGAAAALLALVLLGLLLARVWRSSPTLGHKEADQRQDCDHFKVFPPPVTLLVVSPTSDESSLSPPPPCTSS